MSFTSIVLPIYMYLSNFIIQYQPLLCQGKVAGGRTPPLQGQGKPWQCKMQNRSRQALKCKMQNVKCKIKPSPVGEGGPLGVLKPLFSRLGVLVKRWMRRLRKFKQCSPHPSTPLTPFSLRLGHISALTVTDSHSLPKCRFATQPVEALNGKCEMREG